MKKILLLNPPFDIPVQRDYYCSHTVKGNYLWQPLDLQILSGMIKNHNIFFYDAVYKKHNKKKCLQIIKKLSPQIIISQIGSATLNSDVEFFKKISQLCSSKIVLTGDIARSDHSNILKKYNFIHACITNICHNNINKYIDNFNSKELINIITRISQKTEKIPEDFVISYPKASLFCKKDYNLPYTGKKPVYTILTSFGCPYSCKYCHFENIEYANRNIKDIEDELLNLKKFKFKYIHFRDQTFGYSKPHLYQLNKILKKINLPYSIYTRADVLDYKTLKMLKNTGLDTIETGVESGNFCTRKKYGKIIDDNTYIDFFKNCRKLKIKTVGIFIIGFKEDGNIQIRKTEDFIFKLSPDYLSLNILIPKHGTTMQNTISDSTDLDPSKGLLVQHRLQKIQSRIMRRFYMSPSFIINTIKNIQNPQDILNLSKNAFKIFKDHIR